MTSLDELHSTAEPWLDQDTSTGRARRVVDTGDRADLAALDAITHDCTALAQLDRDLTDQHGAPGLVEDMWLAAYAREPELAEPDEIEPAQRSNRAIAAAMLGTPEHNEMRRQTVGDPYAAAMAVLAQGPGLRRMLRQLDPNGRRKNAHQAQRRVDQAAQQVEQSYEQAADAAGHDLGAEVPRPRVVDVQRAIAQAESAEDEAARLAALLDDENTNPEQAAGLVRAAARAAAADADEELTGEQMAMTAWGVDEGERQRLDPDERMRLAHSLRSGKLAEFAQLIGRFRQLAQAQRSRRVEHARSEYVGVTLGDDLGSLIPAELVNLAVPALRAQFAARYADQQLMVYDQRGEEHEAQGAIIACIDCSGSMEMPDEHGITGEAYAKALALAMLDQAREARPPREFAAILFDTRVTATIRFPADRPVDLADKVRLAEEFTGGGTSFGPPLRAAAELLESEYNTSGRQKADVLFLTDGSAELTDAHLRRWHEAKTRLGFRCFGVSIGELADDAPILDELCDDVRRIDDLSDTHATADMFRAV